MINHIDKALRFLCAAVLVGTLFISCSNDAGKTIKDDTTVEEAKDKIDEVKVLKSAITSSEVTKADATSSDWNKSEAYDLTQVDVPPLFDASCSTSDDPQKCSDEKLLSFISKNMVKPKGRNKASLEQVLVTIEKDGTLQPIKYVASGNQEGCPECQQAAMDVIGKITKWTPAMKDGKAVAVKMAIPVKFS